MSDRVRYALAVIWLVLSVAAAFLFTHKYGWPRHRSPLMWGTFFAVVVLVVVRMILPSHIPIRLIDPPENER